MEAVERVSWGVWVLASLFGACSMERGPLLGSCIEGQSMGCRCGDADDGVGICQSDGTFGSCDCSGEGGASVVDGEPTTDASRGQPSGSDAGAGSGGSGGASGDPGGAGAGTGTSGAGGVGGMASAGAGGAGTGAIDAGAGDAPPPGAYAQCANTDECMGELECTAPPNRGGVGYCTVRCRDAQGAVITDCPSPPTGTVAAECNALTGLCQLGSCLGASCPDGMSCVAVWGGFAGMLCQY